MIKKLFLSFLILLFSMKIGYSADTKISDLGAIDSPALTDVLYVVDDPDGTPVSKKITIGNALGVATDLDANGAVAWGNITEGELANSTVIGADIKDDTIDSADYAAASIDNEHLADNAVDSAELAAGAVDFAHFGTDIITGATAKTAFESGDTFLINEVGVGVREADYDDLPGGAEVNDLETTDPPNVADTEIYIGTGAGTGAWSAMSSEATMDNTGAVTLADSVGVASWNLTTPTITTSLTTDSKTISEAEIGRLDGLAGVIATDATGITNLHGTLLSITDSTLNCTEAQTLSDVCTLGNTFTGDVTITGTVTATLPTDSVSASELNEGDDFTFTGTVDFSSAVWTGDTALVGTLTATNLSGSNTGDDSGTDDQNAAEVSIADGGDIITGINVETALQENRTAINLNTDKETNTDTQDLGIDGNNVTLVDGGTADISTTTAVTANSNKTTESTTAGRSLTLSTYSVAADAELYTDICGAIMFEDPADADDFQSFSIAAVNWTITGIYAETDTGTITFDINIDDGSPAAINGSTMTADSDGMTDTDFAGDTDFDVTDRLDLVITTVSDSPNYWSVFVYGTKDDD